MARPTKMTKTVLAKLEEAFALGCTDVEATLLANISPATLYNHQEKYPEFLERKQQLKETPILKARISVIRALASDPSLAMKFLERRKRDEFSLRHEDDLTVHQVTPILGGRSVSPQA